MFYSGFYSDQNKGSKTFAACLHDVQTLKRQCGPGNTSNGQVDGASASGAADSGLIPSWIKPVTLILVFAASLLDAQHERDSVENKPAS